jgi:hypothetical protein
MSVKMVQRQKCVVVRRILCLVGYITMSNMKNYDHTAHQTIALIGHEEYDCH